MHHSGSYFFYAIFIALAIATFLLVRPFIGVIAVSLITVVMLKPLYDYLLGWRWIEGRPRIATTLTLLAFFLLIIIPLVLLAALVIKQAIHFFESLQSAVTDGSIENLVATVEDIVRQIPGLQDFNFDESRLTEIIQEITSATIKWLGGIVIQFGASLPALFTNVLIFIVLVVTLLPSFDGLIKRFKQLSPLDVDISSLYLRKTTAMIASMIKGVFLIAFLQGLIMGFFYWLVGIPTAAFWMVLSIAFAVLPVVGISFIVLPMAIILFISGDTSGALILLFGFYAVVNPLDVILRPRLVSKEAYLNFALVLLAIFGGLFAAGLLGLVYGPVVMILLMTTIDIYAEYFAPRTQAEKGTESEAIALQSAAGGEAEQEPTLTAD